MPTRDVAQHPQAQGDRPPPGGYQNSYQTPHRGDTRRETVEDLARRYVGTLAPGPSDISVNHWPEAISGVSVRTVETKSKEADAGFDIWVMNTSEVDEEGRAALSVLEVILRKRLIDKLREEMGFSYIGGEVNFKIIEEPESAVDIRIRVIGDPKKITELHQETISEIEKLSVGGFTQEEFASAKKIILKDLDFVRNQDILERLVAWGRSDGQDKTSLSDRRIEISLLTREKTVDFSRIFLNIDNRIEVFRYPE